MNYKIKIPEWLANKKGLKSSFNATIEAETDKAMLLKIKDGKEEWFPKSQIDYKPIGIVEDKNRQYEYTINIEVKDEIEVSFEYNKEIVDIMKNILGHSWSKKKKAWIFPKVPEIAEEILNDIKYLQYDIKKYKINYDQNFQELLNKMEKMRDAAELKYKEDLDQPEKRNFDSWQHQLQAYHYVMERESALLYMGMGTGKTKVAIDVIANRDHKRVLIFCPKSVIDVWKEEIEKHAHDIEEYMICNTKKGTVKSRCNKALKNFRSAEMADKIGVFICNYEAAIRPDFEKFMNKANVDFIIADESQRIKSHGSKVSKSLYKYGKDLKYKLALTGTPMANAPTDIFGQMRFLNEGIFGKYWTHFKNRYCRMGGFNNYEVLEYINQEEMNEKIYSLTYRADRSVLKLPKETHIKRYADLKGKTLKAYKEMKDDLMVSINKGETIATNVLTQLLRLQQIAGGVLRVEKGPDEYEDVTIGKEKATAFSEAIDEIEKEEPIVVFCRFKADINNCKEALKNQGRKPAELSGDIDQLKNFKDGEFDSIVVQVQAGGVGVDLTRAKYCIYYSIGYSLGDYEQSLARISRPGQDSDEVVYIHIIARNTVDEKIYKSIEEKKDIVEAIMEEGL